MNEWQQLKALIDRVKRAEEYFTQQLTETQIEKALDLLQRVLSEIVEVTIEIEKKHGRIDWGTLY